MTSSRICAKFHRNIVCRARHHPHSDTLFYFFVLQFYCQICLFWSFSAQIRTDSCYQIRTDAIIIQCPMIRKHISKLDNMKCIWVFSPRVILSGEVHHNLALGIDKCLECSEFWFAIIQEISLVFLRVPVFSWIFAQFHAISCKLRQENSENYIKTVFFLKSLI